MKLRNINSLGTVFVPALGRDWPAGAVFEVPDDLGANMLLQPSNYERVADDVPRENIPDAIERANWPTPPWWGHSRAGWALLLLRCRACGRPAARFCVQAFTGTSAGALPVGVAIANGRWMSTAGEANACRCTWTDYPSLAHVRSALLKALNGQQPPRSLGIMRRGRDPHGKGRAVTVYSAPR